MTAKETSDQSALHADLAVWSLNRTSVRNNQPADPSDGKKISVKAVCFVPKTSADSDSDKSGSDKKDNTVETQDGTPVEGTTAQKWENCYGALQAPYKDPSLTDLGAVTPISNMPILTRIDVTMNSVTTSFDAQADFGITAAGSYGDAGKPFNSTNLDKGPYLTGVDPDNLHLGVKPAASATTTTGGKAYTDGTTDDTHATDDGVTAIGGGSLKGVSVSNGLQITVQGYPNTSYKLIGWLAPTNSTETSSIHHVFTTVVKSLPAAPADKDELPKDVVQEKFSDWLSNLPTDLKTSDGKHIKDGKYILRVMVVPDGLTTTDSDNTNGAYDGPAYGASNAATSNWTNPGEIEDYAMTLVPSRNIIRFQALIENRYNAPLSMPQNVTYWPGGSGMKEFYRTVSIPAPSKDNNGNLEDPTFHPTISEFRADAAANPDDTNQKLPQYTFNATDDSRNYEMLMSDHLWYDARYQNPNSQAQAHHLTGMVCFRNDNPDSTELGNLMDLSDNKTYHVMAEPMQVKDDFRTDIGKHNPPLVDTTKVTTDPKLTRELRINMYPKNLKRGNNGETVPETAPDVHDVTITCQIPLAPAQMVLPNTGSTAPWMMIVGGVLLLTALGGIATVLVLRRRN